jgi:hypothetical protein
MRTTSRIGSLTLLAVAAGLAVSASGCIVDDGNPGPYGGGACYPDLYVNWQVVQTANNVDTPITCATAGAATLTGQVDVFTDTVTCPAGSSGSSAGGQPLYFPLNQVGTYAVNVQLRDASGNILSQTGVNGSPPSIYVDCSGNTQSPTLVLSISQ